MLVVLLNTIANVAEPVEAVEVSFFSAIGGGGVVAALGFLLLKGVLAQLKQYSELVVSYQNQSNNLQHENGTLNALIDDQRKTLIETQVHLEACIKENELLVRRTEVMSAEILDLKGKVEVLEKQIHGKEKLD